MRCAAARPPANRSGQERCGSVQGRLGARCVAAEPQPRHKQWPIDLGRYGESSAAGQGHRRESPRQTCGPALDARPLLARDRMHAAGTVHRRRRRAHPPPRRRARPAAPPRRPARPPGRTARPRRSAPRPPTGARRPCPAPAPGCRTSCPRPRSRPPAAAIASRLSFLKTHAHAAAVLTAACGSQHVPSCSPVVDSHAHATPSVRRPPKV